MKYSKTCLKRPLKKKTKIGFQDQLSFNAGQKYCRMLLKEHSAILSTFNKLPVIIKIFALSIFEWPLQPGLIVLPFLKVVVILANSTNPGEMPPYTAFHLGPHCLPKYLSNDIQNEKGQGDLETQYQVSAQPKKLATRILFRFRVRVQRLIW